MYDFTLFGGQSLKFVAEFYRKKLLNHSIGFPDKYFVLYTDEVELRKRKNGDNKRRRSGFEMNLRMIEPQKCYFNALKSFNPDLVCFIASDDTETIVETINRTLPTEPCQHTFSVELFDFIINWLASTRAT
ncbi:hypothetical protein J14TS2_31210 [Bacillus sp. J14TS2]|uniref:hypothetical protein n=1 Tax=Bacillus sp. J14TS2 TaxID=2807188 RepID=UPI001AFCEB92|nr:hypothetical protein [Bacillus sp. J14TS2]GIN72646.1 hypothetical protein J14TS2_31210 [Bacillus sp. J14TS2]